MSEDELLLVAKLRGLEPTQDGRVIRALLDLLTDARARAATAGAWIGGLPPCSCKAPVPPHVPPCPAALTYREHVAASRYEWERANALALALRGLIDAVDAEVAIHPGMHDRVAAARREARETITTRGDSHHPGDDGLPF